MVNNLNSELESDPNEENFAEVLSALLARDESRFKSQAIELLEKGSLSISCNRVKINYQIKDKQFCYQLENEIKGTSTESAVAAPDNLEDQMKSLVFMFALSETEVLA